MLIIFYQFLGYLIIPIIKLNTFFRVLKNKEDAKRYIERYGLSNVKRPSGNLIWIHAASVGEFKSASILIKRLHKKYNILITTTTVTASNYAIDRFGDLIIHQYAPFDIKLWVNRFLKKWNPSLVLWIESDLWPITLKTIKEKSIRSLLINSRISPKSFNKWKYIKSFFINITNTFDEIYAQSFIDKNRLEFLTKRKINYIGNLKLALIEKFIDYETLRKLQKKINNYKVLMFASTHKGEEEKFIKIIKKLKYEYKNLKILIAPRHINRSNSILKMFKKEGLSANTIVKSQNLKEDVLIIDSYGKLSLYYSLSDIVILGGSFYEFGGHNPIEPAINNCVVITGPHIYNWENLFLEMIDNQACFICKNINELDKIINNLMQNEEKILFFKSKAKVFSDLNFFESEKLISKINNFF